MRKRSYLHYCSGSRDGVALVMVLAFVVLLTILIISFIAFTKQNRVATASYSKSIQAQEIAQGGLQDILYDLHNEIIAGSITDPNGYTYAQGGTTIYLPSTNYTAVPARLGYAASSWGNDISYPSQGPNLGPSLVRVSRADPSGSLTNLYPVLNTAFFTNFGAVPGGAILNRASSANSSTASANGRSVSASRWNKSFMLAATTQTSGNYSIPTTFVTNTPDWVYVTRTGSRVCQTTELATLKPANNLTATYTINAGQNPPASPVVGRYAFIMYDEGSQIDINAAGYLASATNNYTAGVDPTYTDSKTGNIQAVNGKSYVAYADLTQLSAFPSGASTTTAISNLINWRNASAAPSVGGTLAATNYLQAIFNDAQTGFLSFTNSATGQDSPFVGRQDLINYMAKIDPYTAIIGRGPPILGGFNTTAPTFSAALPYLTTFTREVNAPSYFPQADASALGGSNNNGSGASVYAYRDNAENSNASPFTAAGTFPGPNPNRDLPNVRFAAGGTVTHYNDDASTTTYTVATGDQLLQRRFSLARINWLSQTWVGEPDPGTTAPGYTSSVYPAAIRSCFGLTWGVVGAAGTSFANGGNACWSYVGSLAGTGATAAPFNGKIETLDQVAQENREPNFFELLKAVILSGSIGLSPGQATFANGTTASFDYHNSAGGNYLASTPSSLGMSPAGPVSASAGVDGLYGYTYDGHTNGGTAASGTVSAPAGISDMQIMQIGANIIDQYDSDSYPTAIYFHYGYNKNGTLTQLDSAYDAATTTLGVFGQSDMIYGVENIPYLQGLDITTTTEDGNPTGPVPSNASTPSYLTNLPSYPDPSDPGYVPPALSPGTATTGFSDWWQPVLWNPHQMPNTANTTNSPPQKYQIKGYGQIKFAWGDNLVASYKIGSTNNYIDYPGSGYSTTNTILNTHKGDHIPATYWPALPAGEGNKGTSVPQTLDGNQIISFTDSSPTNSIFYGNPTLLTADTLTNVVATTSLPNMKYNTHMYDYAANHFVGFWAGDDSSYLGTDYSFVNVSAETAGAASFTLGWADSNNGFHPYSFVPGMFAYTYGVVNNGPAHTQVSPPNAQGDADPSPVSPEMHQYVDPRTNRFSTTCEWQWPDNQTFFPNKNSHGIDVAGWGQPAASNFKYYYGSIYGFYIDDWEVNQLSPLASTTATATYYSDPDGVIRPADGVYGNAATGDGMPLFIAKNITPTGSGSGTGGTAVGDTVANSPSYQTTNDKGNSTHGRRPIVLNRPFRNVGELGYTFRDLPFKSLDFFSPYSADAGLLDVFSISDEPKIVAARFNPNNAPLQVLEAFLSYGAKKDLDPNYNLGAESPSQTANVATAIFNKINPATGTSGPLLNRSNLATTLGSVIASSFAAQPDKSNKTYFEGPMRALSSVTNTRTWNLMIDIIAQSGHMSPSAKTLNDFIVEGEKRYWLHIAIDRYTGKIVDQQLETVYE